MAGASAGCAGKGRLLERGAEHLPRTSGVCLLRRARRWFCALRAARTLASRHICWLSHRSGRNHAQRLAICSHSVERRRACRAP
eukprot:5173478-Pleurochrysis_carterae.AAC.1